MLKVMKYDWRNGWYNIRTLLLAAVILSAAAGAALRSFRSQFIPIVWFAVMMALLVLTISAIFQNMSSRMFGPEGYLTHTLPVNTWELLLGKAAGTWLFGVFMVFAAVACQLLLLLCNTGTAELWEALMKVIEALPKLGTYHFRQLATGLGYMVKGVLAFLIVSFLLVVQFQFVCIAAKQFGKFHIAGGIIVFLLLCIFESTWNQSASMGFVVFLIFSAGSFAGSFWLLKKHLTV